MTKWKSSSENISFITQRSSWLALGCLHHHLRPDGWGSISFLRAHTLKLTTVAEGIESWLLGEKLRICRKPNSLVSSRSLPPSLLLSPYSYRKKKKQLGILWWNLSFSSPRLVKLVAVSPIHGTSRPARDHDWLWSIWKFPCHSGCLEGNIWCWSKLINLPSLLFSEKSESVSRSVMSDSLWTHGL